MTTSPTTKVPLIQQNGAPLTNPAPGVQLRPPFRRQGSSFGGGGHVSPMAVMVAPNRIDYSVTKGGLRTWAVLFVFIFLCSSLYTIFSAKDLAELAVDIDGDGIVDIDEEIESNADEVATQYRRVEKDRTPSKDNFVQTAEETKRAHKKTRTAPTTADDELEEEEEPSQEETLLAGLKAKVEENKRKESQPDENDDDDDQKKEDEVQSARSARRKRRRKARNDDYEADDDQQPPAKPRKERRRKTKKEEPADAEDDENDDEEDNKPEPQQRRQRRRRSKKVQQVEDDSEDEGKTEEEPKEDKNKEDGEKEEENKDDDDDDDDDDDEESRLKDETSDDEEEEAKGEEEPKIEEPEASKPDEQKEEQKTDSVAADEDQKSEPKKKKRVKHTTHPKVCKRKNCPPAYDQEPRMELLKQKPQTANSHRNRRYTVKPVEREDQEDFDEFEDDGDDDDEEDQDDDEDNEDEDNSGEITEIAAVKKERLGGRASYKRRAITNRDDLRYRDQLDEADHLVEKHDYVEAFEIYDRILHHNPDSPRAHFGKARAFDIRSEMDADKKFLDMAIGEYQEVLDIDDTPDQLFRQAANRLIDRARFQGSLHKALVAQRSLIDRYPEEIQLQNDFGVTFLMMGRREDAQKVFEDVLRVDANNGVAQAYYGYLLKLDGELEQGVLFMRKGLRAARSVITDARFYYHLGDALSRLGRKAEANKVYSIAAKIGLFLSPYQRSLYNYDGLTARPWWTLEQTTYARHLKNLERQWTIIREEALQVHASSPGRYVPENPHLTINGQWLALSLYHHGEWNESNCRVTPKTCRILRDFKDSSNSSKNQMKVSLLTSGTRIWPHCGYSNCRLQAHLGLVVPSEARIRVADETRGWKTGRFVVFDDSFEHELWFEGASASKMRLVLVVDLWHPEVDPRRRYHFGGLP